MAVAVNGAGDMMVLGPDNQWTPATRARNPDTGEEVYHDGQAWQPVPRREAAPVPPRNRTVGMREFGYYPGAETTLSPEDWEKQERARIAAAQQQPPPPAPSFGRSFGLGTREALQGLGGASAGLIYDLAAAPQNLLNAGVQAATGRDLGLSTRRGAEHISAGLDALGLPHPETPGEQRIGRLVEGAASMLPGMGMGAMLRAGAPAAGSMREALARMLLPNTGWQMAGQGAVGAAAGGASQAAAELGAGPIPQMLAGLLGGGAAGLAGGALGTAARAGGAALAPFTQAGREGIVANTLLQQSAAPGSLQARLAEGLLEPNARLPGSPATTAMVARDPGLAAVEAGLRSDMNPTLPGALTPQARFAALDMQRNATRAAELPAPVPEAAAHQGSLLRSRLDAAQDARRAQTGAAYDAVDPTGTSQIPIAGIRQSMDELSGRYYGPMAGPMPRELAGVVEDLNASGGSVPFGQLQNLRGRLVALQNQFGSDPRAQATLIGLRRAVDEAAETAARPRQPYSAPVTEADLFRQQAAEGAAQRPDVAAVLRGEGAAPPGAGAGPGESLASFIVRNGGVRDDAGEIMQALGGSVRTRPALLNNRSGVPLDRMRAMAQEAGLIGRAGQDVQGQFGTTTDDLVRALQDELNATRGQPRPGMRSLADDVQRDLDQRGIPSSTPPEQVLSAVRDAEPVPLGRPADDGYAPVLNAMTPEQAAAWRLAQDTRRQQGQDFGIDVTGARGVQNILQRGQGGGWNVPDPRVVSHALTRPDAARQVLRAAPDTLPTLRQAFMDRAFEAAAGKNVVQAADGNPSLGAPGFGAFWTANRDLAAALFPPEQLNRLQLLANDFGEAATFGRMAQTRGSDTARNLSVANVISMASRGMLDPRMPGLQALMAPFGSIMRVSGLEGSIRNLMTEAMANPALAERLLARATPEAMEQAAGYMRQTLGQRAGEAARTGVGGLMLRTGEAEVSAERRQGRALARMLMGAAPQPGVDPRGMQAALAKQLAGSLLVATGGEARLGQ